MAGIACVQSAVARVCIASEQLAWRAWHACSSVLAGCGACYTMRAAGTRARCYPAVARHSHAHLRRVCNEHVRSKRVAGLACVLHAAAYERL